MLYILVHLFIVIILISKSYAEKKYVVSTVDEFKEVLTALNDTRTIIVDGVLEGLNKEIKIRPPANSGSITIKGKDGRNSRLEFIAGTIGLTFENLTYVEISSISFVGRLNFKYIDNVLVEDINHNGLFDTINPDGFVRVNNIDYVPYERKSRANSVKMSAGGNIIFENSRFTANIGCTDSLMKYYGKGYDKIECTIRNCIFDSRNFANGIIIQVANLTLENTEFYNGFSKMHSAFATIRDSTAYVRNCTFKDGYSISSGGVFNTVKNYYFEADGIKVYNTTSYNGGGLFYEDTDLPDSVTILKNIEYINLWKDFPTNGLGSIIYLKNYSKLKLSNLYGEGFYCLVLTCNLFQVFHFSVAELNNIYIKNVHGREGGVIFYGGIDNEPSGMPVIKASDCNFVNIEQETSIDSSMIWSDGCKMELN
eukprot:jgi/Orpsp1_1/1178179/evm.model.c7180000064338.1